MLVKGGGYAPNEIVGREIVASYGGKVCVTGRIAGVSTTAIVAAARRAGRCVEEGRLVRGRNS